MVLDTAKLTCTSLAHLVLLNNGQDVWLHWHLKLHPHSALRGIDLQNLATGPIVRRGEHETLGTKREQFFYGLDFGVLLCFVYMDILRKQ